MDDIDVEFEILPELTPQQLKDIEIQQMNRLIKFYSTTQEYEIERWYKPLADFTFSSFSFPLTNIEGYLLTCLYHEDEKALNQSQIKQAKKILKEKVSKFLQEHFPQGCFMKLSTRSPKDVGWRYQDESQINRHAKRLTELLQGTKSLDKEARNKIYRYFLQQSKDKIKINSADDFMDVFSHSQRIQIDLNEISCLNNRVFNKLMQGDYSSANQKLIDIWGREWVNCKWMQEFRCFFNNYKLTALCQYDQRCYFPQLKGQQQNVKNKINSFFEKIKPKLKQINMEKGVMDLIVKFDEENPVTLIQINVFDYNSRASLFNWQTDLQIIQNGPLELRIHSQQIEISKYELAKMMGMVEKGIQNVLNQVMKRLNLEAQWKHLQ